MRSNCAVYVDAGYLLASAATHVTGTSLRNGIHVEFGKLIASLIEQAEQLSGLPVLRVHWYDSARDGVPDVQQQRIGELPKVKLRLGRFGVDGQQKGVDLRMGLDLVTHARNRTADVFVLVSGDDDLTEAVEEAQVHGVQVVLVAIPNAEGRPHGVSRHLLRAADELVVLTPAAVAAAVTRVQAPAARAVEVAATPAPSPSAVPTPNDIAARPRPVRVPAAVPAPAAVHAPVSVLAYSGSTGEPPRILTQQVDLEQYEPAIETVVDKMLDTLLGGASTIDLQALEDGRPMVAREIDSALLRDLSSAVGIEDLDDPVRYRLRARFWELFDGRRG
jgi:uncharacterized LabA/DUF88 family protein